jgi:hypothetical protein
MWITYIRIEFIFFSQSVQSRLDRRLHEMGRDLVQNREVHQRRLPNESKTLQSRTEHSTHQFEETGIDKSFFTQQVTKH